MEAIDSVRENVVYAPAAIIVGGGLFSGVKWCMGKLGVKSEILSCLLAILFTAVFVMLWVADSAFPCCDLKEGTIVEELPLIFAAGIYLASVYPVSGIFEILDSVQRVVAVIGIGAVLHTKNGSNVADTMGYFTELPAILWFAYQLSQCEGCEEPVLGKVFGYAYAAAFVAKILGLGFVAYLVVTGEAETFVKVMVVLYFLATCTTVGNLKTVLMGKPQEEEPPQPRRRPRSRGRCKARSRSRSKSRSRSRSRSGGCRPKKKKC